MLLQLEEEIFAHVHSVQGGARPGLQEMCVLQACGGDAVREKVVAQEKLWNQSGVPKVLMQLEEEIFAHVHFVQGGHKFKFWNAAPPATNSAQTTAKYSLGDQKQLPPSCGRSAPGGGLPWVPNHLAELCRNSLCFSAKLCRKPGSKRFAETLQKKLTFGFCKVSANLVFGTAKPFYSENVQLDQNFRAFGRMCGNFLHFRTFWTFLGGDQISLRPVAAGSVEGEHAWSQR